MKYTSFLSLVIAAVLVVVLAGCSAVPRGADEQYRNETAHRIYVDDPYQGTIVLERDPATGRYYQVSPVYSSRYNTRYPYRYDRYRYDNRYNYPRGNTRPPTPQQQKDWEKKREDARKKVLGQ